MKNEASTYNLNPRAQLPPPRQPFYFQSQFWIVVTLFLILLIAWQYETPDKQDRHRRVSAPVMTAIVATHDVPIYINALGTVLPTDSVTVRTQLNGTLIKVLFREGQMVKANELLAEIDARPYQAQLMQYEGQLAADQARLANAKIDLQRYQVLWKQDSVAQQTLATQISLVKQLEGAIKADIGLIQTAKINIDYAQIRSPIEGRIGLRRVDPGNYVQTGDSLGIATVNRLNPITVIFTIPEDDIDEVTTEINNNNILLVEAFDRQQEKLLLSGKLLSLDNQIDTLTGTVKLKAQFENQNNILFPNQFVNIKLLVKILKNATTVPTAAIQHTAKGSFVYVLDHKNLLAKLTPVTTGVTIHDLTTILSGVRPGETIITAGTDKLSHNAKVTLAHHSRASMP